MFFDFQSQKLINDSTENIPLQSLNVLPDLISS